MYSPSAGPLLLQPRAPGAMNHGLPRLGKRRAAKPAPPPAPRAALGRRRKDGKAKHGDKRMQSPSVRGGGRVLAPGWWLLAPLLRPNCRRGARRRLGAEGNAVGSGHGEARQRARVPECVAGLWAALRPPRAPHQILAAERNLR